MKSVRAAIITLAVASMCAAQPLTEDTGAAGLGQTLRKLKQNVRVLHIAAHPDDEDAATLTWLARGEGAHVVLLSLNRGEAGANLVSSDFFDRLGALRTVEFLRACDYYGAAGLRFTRLIDYGYSKNVAETFRNWKREEALGEVVRIIREEQPHVILSRFQGTPRDGHGNHEAAGILARKAFDAAGDAFRFPQQIAAGFKPWQPLKYYVSNRRENDGNTVRVDSGIYDPALGKTYAQMGRLGYRQHRSQGAGGPIPLPGPSLGYYKLGASRVGMAESEKGFFERLDTGLGQWPRVEAAIRALTEVPATMPERLAPLLAGALEAVRAAGPPSRDLQIKERQLLLALDQALGIHFDALVDPDQPVAGPAAGFRAWESFTHAIPGQRFTVTASFTAGVGQVNPERIQITAPPGWSVEPLPNNRFAIRVAGNAPATAAYWSRASVRETTYDISDEKWFGLPLTPPPLRARAFYRIHGVEASVEREVQTSLIDPLGLQYRRVLAVAPAISLRVAEGGYLPLSLRSYPLTVVARNHSRGPVNGRLRLDLPAGWSSRPDAAGFAIEKENEESAFEFELQPPAGVKPGAYAVRAVAEVGGRQWSATFQTVTQPGLEAVHLSGPARHEIQALDVRVAPGLRTAYITGTGDGVPEAMRQLGAAPEILDSGFLAAGDLSRFHTIVLGIRAYAVRRDVKAYNARLLEYVNRGGVLIVQYNTQEYDNNFGPYPYSMTMRAEEVSEEDAPVTILDPTNTVFHFPNRISAADFAGWVEQRGSKFFTTWDERWKPLVETHDTGQSPQKGVWLAARYGKGLYIYCALAWYRQLPFAVPGAGRIFANLISLGDPEAPWRAR